MMLALTVLGAVLLVGCQETKKLTRITWTGTDDVMNIEFGSEFNILTGVTAVGDDEVDYTSQITFNTTAKVTNNLLDTETVGKIAIKYTVKVGDFVADKWRYLEVLNPGPVEGQMLINPDFSQGTGGWTDPSVNYISDGAAMTISAEDGALKVEVVAGSNPWTPRFGQMNVPFENGKTYEITFRAKSSVEKTINLQVGELITVAPWFVDFKLGQAVTKLITTEWATYSFKFTMNQPETNHRGGILFELGTLAGQSIDATLWFDDITIEEATADPDTTAPTFTGLVPERTVLLNGTFDPLAGVTAFDIVDGNVTSDIVVEIKDASNAVVTTIDTSVETTYTIKYTVEDEAGNKAEFIVTLSVVGMQFKEQNLLVNGNFEAALGDPSEWDLFLQDWDTPAAATFNIVGGVAVIDIANLGSQPDAWSIQFKQLIPLLEEGKTYRASFDIKSSVARDFNFVLTNANIGYYEYVRSNGIVLTSEWQTVELVFTAARTSENTNFEFDLGNSANGQVGIVSIDNVKLQEAILDDLLLNPSFDEKGFFLWSQDWDGVAEVTYTEGAGHVINIVSPGSAGEPWTIQFNQGGLALVNGKTYELKFDVVGTAARDMNVKIFVPGSYTPYLTELGVPVTTEVVSKTFEFTVTEASYND